MKILKMVAVLAILVAVSCKKDKDAEINALVGHWHVLNFEPDGASDNSILAKEAVRQLVESECFPIEYSFNTSGKVSHIDKMSYIDTVEGDDGVEVYCFFENIFKDGSYSISNNMLTLNYEDTTQVLNINVTNDRLTILKGDFVFNDEKISGKLVLTKEAF